jgi:hypothetical protein
MLPNFLINDSVQHEDGASSEIELGSAAGKVLLVTLGITRIIEQESLDLSLHGSADKAAWIPVAAFPQKFYCGTYSILVDLSPHPELRFLRAQWKMSRWGRGEPKPLFGFYLFAKESAAQAVAAG